ncbi:putative ATP-dependent Clp protease proteolytic subunit, mitochondrial [Tetrabaena socialis]|uniref:ATP-dependent Clp protease proteolytic subunit n=1 Tax=Tetrabaena socialis TaxID=47790 RepID=A0A2J8A1S6_9CHLO|nr:putative ATP-dependent Clp protease proteolytic subunit, mitochondrial [Tetrabaena socialis]|eukprot:PNH06460.1 putative ATP-dependent Clp protease proteolytic subunit, mitochondrial [Tetrabaena socialis]
MTDDDLFSDKVTHVYFYGEVTTESVRQLKADVAAACNPEPDPNGVRHSPKPILLHINSPGGSLDAGLSSMSILQESRVPIAVMVDGLACSAATFLSIAAPYRIAHSFSTCLIHQFTSFMFGKEDRNKFTVDSVARTSDYIFDIYEKRTKLTKEDVATLVRRGVLLSAVQCHEYGIFDRILNIKVDPSKHALRHPELNLATSVLLRKTNMNHVNIECGLPPNEKFDAEIMKRIDTMLFTADALEVKPIIFRANTSNCSSVQGCFPLLARINSIKVPTLAVIDTWIDLYSIIPLLFCSKRVMYDNSILLMDIVYVTMFGPSLQDMYENTMLVVRLIKSVLRARTSLPAAIIDNIEKERVALTPADCLKYGVVDEVIRLV